MRNFQIQKSKVKIVQNTEGFKIKHNDLDLFYCGNSTWEKESSSNLVFKTDKKVREFLNRVV